ncbi:MAG: DUF2312 domain-containing protein [Rickettsiaceae bacterium]|nr:DUF2312 domain-containing protein [Rickettsiaceae bacterium]
MSSVEAEVLKQFVMKLERLENDKAALAQDIKEVCAEAKSHGLEVKLLKQLVKLVRMDKNKLQEYEALLEVYRTAIGV